MQHNTQHSPLREATDAVRQHKGRAACGFVVFVITVVRLAVLQLSMKRLSSDKRDDQGANQPLSHCAALLPGSPLCATTPSAGSTSSYVIAGALQ